MQGDSVPGPADVAGMSRYSTFLASIATMRRICNTDFPGTAYFGPLELTVRPGVLIPRWETAEWTERLCRDIVPRLAAPYRQTLRVIDLCTGSGCIALLMSTMLQHATIEGYDIAAASVRLANRNATRALREPDRRRVRFRLLDVQTERVDQVLRGATVVCANPPYIDTHRPIGLSLSARRWEPSRALVAEQAGDAIISRIVSRSVATPSVSLVAIEVDGQAQASRTMHMVDASWRTEALRDSAGVIRCVILLRSAHGS